MTELKRGLEAWLPEGPSGPCWNGCCSGGFYCIKWYRETLAPLTDAVLDAVHVCTHDEPGDELP